MYKKLMLLEGGVDGLDGSMNSTVRKRDSCHQASSSR
jgi:hypothetical protein